MGLIEKVIGLFADKNEASIYVPSMDGAFKPNSLLDQSTVLSQQPAADCVVEINGKLLFSSGSKLLQIDPKANEAEAKLIHQFDNDITFITVSNNGTCALMVQSVGIFIAEDIEDWHLIELDEKYINCAVAACFINDELIAFCVGSTSLPADEWKRDLLEKNSTGQIVTLDIVANKVTEICTDLAFPNGIVALDENQLAIAESWKHRIIKIDMSAPQEPIVVLDNLPAYPARLSQTQNGGFLVAMFAPKRQLFEMILNEDEYRQDMMAELDPKDWVAPEMSVSTAPDQPISQGMVRQMGVVKPWAPSRSYGLAALCDADFKVVKTWHSRADGLMHGITATCAYNGEYYATSKGNDCLIKLAPQE